MSKKNKESLYQVSEMEYKTIQMLKQISKEDKQRQRLILMEANLRKVAQTNREIDYKQKQFDSKEVTEKHDSFVDGKKPLFYLQNDIEDLKAIIKELEFNYKRLEEEYKKDSEEQNA